MNFCSNCGARVELAIPEGDNRQRYCCSSCGTIHYQNPRLVVGTVPVWQENGQARVLLCKRAIEPRAGFWTLPAGFLENGEAASDGAIRETTEEAGARIVLGTPFTLYDVIHAHQVHLFYLATLVDTQFAPGIESLEVKLCSEDEIPWPEIAFRTVTLTLEHYFADRNKAAYGVHTGSINLPRRISTTDGPEIPPGMAPSGVNSLARF